MNGTLGVHLLFFRFLKETINLSNPVSLLGYFHDSIPELSTELLLYYLPQQLRVDVQEALEIHGG